MNKENNIYTIKRIVSVKNANYDEESYRKALEDQRIQKLLNTGNLLCEYFPNNDLRSKILYPNARFCTVDLLNACARIIKINDDNIKIKLLENTVNGALLKRILDNTIDDIIVARMRGMRCYNKNSKFIINKLITFDITPINEREVIKNDK